MGQYKTPADRLALGDVGVLAYIHTYTSIGPGAPTITPQQKLAAAGAVSVVRDGLPREVNRQNFHCDTHLSTYKFILLPQQLS